MNVYNPVQQSEQTGSLWERLKGETRSAHGSLDGRIMEGKPFADRDRYGRFLLVQHDFHQIVSPLYQHGELGKHLPDLSNRDRFAQVKQDLADLAIAEPATAPAGDQSADLPTAIGWLYVAEGSNLGAAFLLKAARELGLSEEFGARHLAGAPEGRGLHWKTFTEALDTIPLTPAEADRVVAGANAAFTRVRDFVEDRFFASEQV